MSLTSEGWSGFGDEDGDVYVLGREPERGLLQAGEKLDFPGVDEVAAFIVQYVVKQWSMQFSNGSRSMNERGSPLVEMEPSFMEVGKEEGKKRTLQKEKNNTNNSGEKSLFQQLGAAMLSLALSVT